MNLQRLRIGPRIGLGFATVLAALIAVALIGYLGLLRSDAHFERFGQLASQTSAILDIERRVVDLQRRVLAFTYSGYEGIVVRVRGLVGELREEIASVRSEVEDSEQTAMLERMSELFELYATHFELAVAERQVHDRWIAEGLGPLSERAVALLTELRQRLQGRGARSSAVELLGASLEALLLAHQDALAFQNAPDAALVQSASMRVEALGMMLDAVAEELEDPVERERIEVLRRLIGDYRAALNGMVQSTRAYLHLVYVVLAGEAAELDYLTQTLKQLTLAQQQELRARMSHTNWRSRNIALLLSVLAIAVTGLLSWRIARGITQPLVAVSNALTDITHGRLETEIPFRDRTDEIGAMAQATSVFRQEIAKKERAEAASRSKSQFLAHMSHELRTPLNAILGFSELMAHLPDTPDKQRGYLETINRSGSHLLSMINDILDMSKIEAGEYSARIEPFDLIQLLADVKSMFSQRAEQAGLSFVLEADPDLPQVIESDAGKIRQVLINLLGNAIKLTEEGGVVLRVRTLAAEGGRQRLSVEVEDTGPGIASDRIAAIFRPFVQADRGGQEGTGLGLAICSRFVDMLGGEIDVTSEPGRGACFRFWVPIALGVSARIQPESRDRLVIGLEPHQPAYRLLSVEDNPNNRRLLASLLSAAGLDFREASNGAEGVGLFKEWRPDLIFMDIRMPVMDGREATQRIRQLPGGKYCKIIAVTASSFREEREQILAQGFDDFLGKPYRSAAIYDLLTRHLGVRFRYAEGDDEALTADMPASASTLPKDLVADLKKALILGDSELVGLAVSRIAAASPPVAAALQRRVAEYRYERVLRWIREGDEQRIN